MIEHVVLLADIHANEIALKAVEHDVFARYNGERLRFWFLGDLFGRGPDPEDTWDRLMHLKPEASVVGNHDWFITRRTDKDDCVNLNGHDPTLPPKYHHDSMEAYDCDVLMDHRQRIAGLSKDLWLNANVWLRGTGADFINQLPVVHVPRPGIYLVHGGLKGFSPPAAIEDPEVFWASYWREFAWGYVKEPEAARATIEALRWLHGHRPTGQDLFVAEQALQQWAPPQLAIVGHWHHRRLYQDGICERALQLDRQYPLASSAENPVLISPGSVGFSNEDDRRVNACYALLELKGGMPAAVTYHAVEFDRAAMRQRMRVQGYSRELIKRLCRPGESV